MVILTYRLLSNGFPGDELSGVLGEPVTGGEEHVRVEPHQTVVRHELLDFLQACRLVQQRLLVLQHKRQRHTQ